MGFGHHHDHDTHAHGAVDAAILQSREATRVLMISLIGLIVTAMIQAVIVMLSGSVALLADTIHNFADALTSIPLWFAFMLSRRLPSKRFSYGLNRSEDIAGLMIVLVIASSAFVAAYESVTRIMHGTSFSHLWTVAIAALIGFFGNEIVAIYRIRMGRKMGSAALLADGQHARVDGFTSLAVLLGVIGTWLGYPIVDPIVGLLITVMILFVVRDSVKAVFTRLLDGIEPEVIELITTCAMEVEGVRDVFDVQARWFGHEIRAGLSITVESNMTVVEAHEIAKRVMHHLYHEIPHLIHADVHIDPLEEGGATFHTHDYFHKDDPNSEPPESQGVRSEHMIST